METLVSSFSPARGRTGEGMGRDEPRPWDKGTQAGDKKGLDMETEQKSPK